MRVLMTADAIGGVLTYATNLCRALDSHGVEVVLATMGRPMSSAQRIMVNALPNVRSYESEYQLEWMPNPWEDVRRAGHWLREIAARERVDFVHLNGYAHGAFEFGVPKLVVAHSCVLSWWSAVKKTAPPAAWDGYREAIRKGLSAADVVAAPTAAMLEQIVQLYGTPRRALVIHNGSDLATTSAPAKQPCVLSAGRLWDDAKNLRALNDVASSLAWPVYAAGSALAPSGEYVSLSHLRLLGELSPGLLQRCLERAAIYALPAFYEPFGLSVLEAAQAECALVLGDIPSLRELWDGAAWFVAPEDQSQLAWALSELINDGSARERSARCAAKRAKRFGLQRMASAYFDLYRNVIQEHRATENSTCA